MKVSVIQAISLGNPARARLPQTTGTTGTTISLGKAIALRRAEARRHRPLLLHSPVATGREDMTTKRRTPKEAPLSADVLVDLEARCMVSPIPLCLNSRV